VQEFERSAGALQGLGHLLGNPIPMGGMFREKAHLAELGPFEFQLERWMFNSPSFGQIRLPQNPSALLAAKTLVPGLRLGPKFRPFDG
jgi:hypothetical protein